MRGRPSEGQTITVNMAAYAYHDPEIKKEAVVDALLDVQFVARLTDGTDTMVFRFYNDKGRTWWI